MYIVLGKLLHQHGDLNLHIFLYISVLGKSLLPTLTNGEEEGLRNPQPQLSINVL
jgi:hypothetical protein